MEQFWLILGIVWLAVISPGADFAMVSRTSFIDGRRAGVLAACGIATACWIHIAYAVFGLEILGRIFPHLLDVVKIAGAAYLIYLGATMALARPTTSDVDVGSAQKRPHAAFLTGFLTNALNPKTSIFVVSLYAQIMAPGTPMPEKLGYGVLISAVHAAWFITVAIFLSNPAIRSRVLAKQRMVNMSIGCVLILLGFALFFADL